MARKSESRYRPDQQYKPDSLYSTATPIPGRTYQIAGKVVAGIHKVQRIRAKTEGVTVFLVEGDLTEYEVAKHKYRPIEG